MISFTWLVPVGLGGFILGALWMSAMWRKSVKDMFDK